jgi:23S rRNA (guanine745-N1)-methyltransferase
MRPPPLACTVRTCGLALERHERTLVCARGHSYDIARSGYVSLLQPQDRRSTAAGDPTEAVDARARLLASGVGATILNRFVEEALGLELGPEPAVIDLGSGSGDVLGAFARQRRIVGVGIDLSKVAAARAARRFPDVAWVIANADRRLPILQSSVALALSFHGRRLPDECRRVLVPDGFLLVGIPGDDDLIELRTRVQGAARVRGRGEKLVAEHASMFTVISRFGVREHHHLSGDALRDLLAGTYRGARASTADTVSALEELDVTLASEMFLFQAKR